MLRVSRTDDAEGLAGSQAPSTQLPKLVPVLIPAVSHWEIFDMETLVSPFSERQFIEIIALRREIQPGKRARKILGKKTWISVAGTVVRDDPDIATFCVWDGSLCQVGDIDIHDC